ncbi:MAG: V-type ATP synthase subunit D [Rhabdochlamydiaceae bacterium]|nr:V-type ATP synthase subunit D [Candidatus Amphrikana amoebophyrae]
MSEIRLTKNELRNQQHKLDQLTRYLPTLQLKKAMLQLEVGQVQARIVQLTLQFDKLMASAREFSKLFSDSGAKELFEGMQIKEVLSTFENIAGVEIPVYEGVEFNSPSYSLIVAPFWWDSALFSMRELIKKKKEIEFAQKKKAVLEEELRSVSIRVNLFEKILIPRTNRNIKKIKVFLGDQQLSAVATSKVAKQKMMKKAEEESMV